MNSEQGFQKNQTVLALALSNRTLKLHKDRIVIGSVVSADVRLLGTGVAPIHAVLELTQDPESGKRVATLFDLASETGVYVNGKKIITETVKPGDEITIGLHKFKFSFEDLSKISSQESVRESGGRKLFLNPKEDFSPLLLESEAQVEDIFDYRPSFQQALQVVMSWCGTILDVEHFTKEKAVTIGVTRRSHFGIPPVLSVKRFEIVTRHGDNFTLNLDAQMTGVIQRDGKLQSLENFKTGVGTGSQGFQVPLKQDDFAKINLKGIEFYLSFTPSPPRLKRKRLFDKDPLYLKMVGSSLGISLALVLTLLSIEVPQTLDAEQLPERIATILYQPEKFPSIRKTEVFKKAEVVKSEVVAKNEVVPKKVPTPKETVKIDIQPKAHVTPKPVPKEMDVGKTTIAKATGSEKKTAGGRAQGEAKEGKGARAKGKEGTRGSPKAPKGATPQDSARRPSPQGGKGSGSGQSQVIDEGNVDLLKGASSTIQNLLGNSALHLGKGGEKLKGFGAFTTQGTGGLALSGEGKGGGGDAASLGGLSDTGRGGGRVGTGYGAAGSGAGIVGGKTRVVIKTGGAEETVVMGAIDADAIEAAILAHKDEFRLCYEREINAETPNLSGRVGTSFVIGSSGRVTQAGVASTTLNHANAERCILDVIKRIQFPLPRGSGIVQVNFPFKFSSGGGK